MKRPWASYAARAAAAYVGTRLKLRKTRPSTLRVRGRKGGRRRARLLTKTGSRTTQRNRRRTTESSGAILSGTSLNTDRKLRKTTRNAWRVLNNHTEKYEFDYNSVSTYGGQSGAVFLNNFQTANGNSLTCPVHVYEMTGIVNANETTITPAVCGYGLQFTNETSTGVASWTNFGDWNARVLPGPSSAADSLPGNRAMLNWISAKLLFYAPQSLPVRISVEFIQLKDERLHPLGFGTGNFASAFWQYMAKQYMANPIVTMESQYARYVKVLKRVSFMMDPKYTDNEGLTNYKIVKIFMRMNRKSTFNWNQSDKANLDDPNDPQIDFTGFTQSVVHPKARIYMIVRGQAGQSVTANNVNFTPSYDVALRTQYSRLE